MTVPDTLLALADQLRHLGDPSTADTVTCLADSYRTGLLDQQAVLDLLDDLIALQQVRS